MHDPVAHGEWHKIRKRQIFRPVQERAEHKDRMKAYARMISIKLLPV